MAVSENDVLHVAALARLAIDPARLPSLVAELNGILAHMEVLEAVEGGRGTWDVGETGSSTPMRDDTAGTPIPLSVPRESFAPQMKDGFFLVPRLATHEDQGERAP
ncbi:MAG TPA: Asp-tRNA(Asn)/Glu-tRNA(Gln) amidotransferase subunit GatC [Gemmatimonadaceae bacterium]|nr:Asp-tRNA(Asn)/Glu-tRNA(Gln) amidotransferase subunit GatC [Gemmatimonadaceae bacterium]